MSLKPSRYNHFVEAPSGGQTILFNKMWGSVVVQESALAERLNSGSLEGLSEAEIEQLCDAGFLVDSGVDEINFAHSMYLNRKAENTTLSIIVEVTQECNLACSFCYQNSYRKDGAITEQGADWVLRYLDVTLARRGRPFRDVVLSFIGGEPLMQKERLFSMLREARKICEKYDVRLCTQVDTNGMLIDEQVIQVVDSFSVTITNREDHDAVRVRKNGAGSYDQIVKKLRLHADAFNRYDTALSIRFNANVDNHRYVPEIYHMALGLGVEDIDFDLHNTVNYSYNGGSLGMSKADFSQLYLEVLALKLASGKVITAFPRPSFAPCAAYTPFNVKFTADGRLTACDAMYSARGNAAKLALGKSTYAETFADLQANDPFRNPVCRECSNVGICGGELFCKSNPDAPDSGQCDFLPYDMDDFLRFFVQNYPARPDLFDLNLAGETEDAEVPA